jgi:predicted DCC family thiol-disulfide oxidoreductase YuxK
MRRGRASTVQPPERLTLIFDGMCGFCTRSVRLLEALDRHRRVRVVPYQRPGAAASVGLTVEESEAAAWAIAPDGQRYRAAAVVNTSLAVALGTSLPLLFYALPGVRPLQDLIYDFVAANRDRLPGDEPYCEQQPIQCR